MDDRSRSARPRAARPDRGRRRLHGQHARLSGAHVRPALSPLLPLQRPRERAAGAERSHARPRGRRACRCCRSRAAATASRRWRPAITSASCSRTRRPCSSRPPPAVTSACSPAARRAGRRGCCSTASWPSTRRPAGARRRRPGRLSAQPRLRRGRAGGYPDADATGAHHPLPHLLAGRRSPRPPRPPRSRRRSRASATGVTVSGVDVGDLTVAEAQAKLEQTLGPLLSQDIVVTAARRRFTLKMAADRLRVPRRQDRAARALRRPGRAAGARRHRCRRPPPSRPCPTSARPSGRFAEADREGRHGRPARREGEDQADADDQAQGPQGPQAARCARW